MDDFYITLPSNVINSHFNNSVAHYKTKLATRIELNGDWVVGMTSISYTKSWNMKEEIGKFELCHYKLGVKCINDEKFSIILNDFQNVEDIVDKINEILEMNEKENLEYPRLFLNTQTLRIEIQHSTNDNFLMFIKFSPNLCKIFGFDKNKLDLYIDKWMLRYFKEGIIYKLKGIFSDYKPEKPPNIDNVYYAEEPFNIFPSFANLYVYSNIVKYSFFGNTYDQLMRVIEVPPKYNFRDQIFINYPDIHYIPLLKNEIEEIEIHIKDEDKKTIPFLFGRTIITLHFKKL